MLTAIEQFDMSQILQPAQRPDLAIRDAVKWGASLTITRGQAVGIKTADHLAYAFASGQSDGTQNFVGFSLYTFKTDSNGLVYYGPTTSPDLRLGPFMTSPIYIKGIFDPQDLQTAATPVQQVLTFTPGGTITTGDVDTLTYTYPDGTTRAVSFTVGGTTTAAAVSAGLIAAWNADNVLSQIATASGTTTVILTSVTAGNSDAIASSVTGVGTLSKATTTAASGRALSDITTSRPGCYVMHNGFWYIP